jgi:hypothetical protein
MERIIKIIVMELNSDILKLEGDLEKTMNSNMDINSLIKKSKEILSELVLKEKSLAKFNYMINNNNEKLKEK